MKNSILFLVATLALAQTAQAASNQISGAKAIAQITGDVLDPKNGPFEGDDCTIELVRRGHDLEIKAKSKDENFSIEISEDLKYKLTDTSKGEDSKITVSSLNRHESVTVEAASDAFIVVTVVKDGAKVSCEQDM